jgi:hypothetical protein
MLNALPNAIGIGLAGHRVFLRADVVGNNAGDDCLRGKRGQREYEYEGGLSEPI